MVGSGVGGAPLRGPVGGSLCRGWLGDEGPALNGAGLAGALGARDGVAGARGGACPRMMGEGAAESVGALCTGDGVAASPEGPGAREEGPGRARVEGVLVEDEAA